MYPEIEVEISNTQGHMQVDLATLDQLVRVVLAAEHRLCGSISIVLVDNATIHAINRTHLGHDWPTDVITFPLAGPDAPDLAGELVVSAEMACAVAQEIGVEPAEELALYVVHGLLHLCGYDDHDDADRRQMRHREGELLSHAGLTNPYGRADERPVEPRDSGAGEGPSLRWSPAFRRSPNRRFRLKAGLPRKSSRRKRAECRALITWLSKRLFLLPSSVREYQPWTA
jgi:probable rRNA maturation factor